MKNNKILSLIRKGTSLALFLASGILFARETEYVKGDLLVQFHRNTDVEAFTQNFNDIGLRTDKLLTRRMNIWLLKFDPSQVSDEDALLLMKSHPFVQEAQFNHLVQERVTTPNDASFNNQWGMNNTGQSGGTVDADIDAPEAWDITTGGMTVTGEQIVVAIVDGGFDIGHSDIDYFKNTNEVPGNGIDDDNNGYVDDYDGWDAYSSDGTIPNGNHGTHVAGIAAAIGNNNIGVAGVSWGAKVMPIAGSSGNESTVVEAYGYALEMRKKYDETNGVEGAFVVSTNASFGIDFGDPANSPLWCAFYDSLGAAGILNAGATANLNIDIDVDGDVPTACPSDYMIAVTNTRDNDTKNNGAAYGLTTIDLGSPGTAIYSTTQGGGYGNLTGTSMATPHVCGAVAFLYAGASAAAIAEYKANPAQVALDFRDMLYNGTDPIPALNGITVTGGRLNIFNSIQLVQNYFPFDPIDPAAPTNTVAFSDFQTPNSVTLTWEDPDSLNNGDPISAFSVRIFRDGNMVSEVAQGLETFTETGLNDGDWYEYTLVTRLTSNDSLSTETEPFGAFAGGSRVPATPTNIQCSFTNTDITLTWDDPTTQEDGTSIDDLDKIEVFRDGISIALVQPGVQTFTDNPPVSGLFYYYSLRAWDNETPVNYSAYSDTIQCFMGDLVSLNGNIVDEVTLAGITGEVELGMTLLGEPVINTTTTDANGNFSFAQIPVLQGGVLVYDYVKVTPDDFNYATTIFPDTTLNSGGNPVSMTYKVPRIDFFLVDDDGGDTIEDIYFDAMENGGLSYRYWNVETDGEPTQTEFNSLLSRNIIWFTGWEDNTALTSANLTELEAFLLQGGNLFLTGVDIANAVQGTSFADNYLGGVADISGVTASFLKGNSNHPVGDGKIYSISTPTQNQRDGLSVSNGIIAAQFGTIGNLAPAIVLRDETNFKTVIAGFEAGGISTTANPAVLSPLSTLLLNIDTWWDTNVNINEEFDFTAPVSYSLKQNFPNPFNPNTQISFVLPQEENVTVSVFNVKGQLVNTLFNGVGKFGQNKVVWNGTNSKGNSVSSGIYFYKLQTESGFKQTKKMLLLK